jgi:hypothetical protein
MHAESCLHSEGLQDDPPPPDRIDLKDPQVLNGRTPPLKENYQTGYTDKLIFTREYCGISLL